MNNEELARIVIILEGIQDEAKTIGTKLDQLVLEMDALLYELDEAPTEEQEEAVAVDPDFEVPDFFNNGC